MKCSAKHKILFAGILIALLLLLAALLQSESITISRDNHNHKGQLKDTPSSTSGNEGDNGDTDNPSKGLEYDAQQFYLNDKPFRIISGSLHYFRIRPEQWRDRLERMSAAGLNTVDTYVAWNVHERQRGVYDFSADGYDLVRFIQLVQELDMYMILRPGPYICAEFEFGGFPSWLLHDPDMKVRTSRYQPYLTHVERYFTNLLPKVKPYTFKRGGPIIAFQVENEFGSSNNSPDKPYLQFIVEQYKKNDIREFLFTSDNSWNLAKGSLINLLATANFNDDSGKHLERLHEFRQGKQPLMVAEFWPGWFDSWGGKHNFVEVKKFWSEVSMVLSVNASLNLYMFSGGTNFEFWNGASLDQDQYAPTITSYDYDSLISESGDVHPTKYQAFRDLLVKYGYVSKSALLPIPENPRKVAYGTVKIEQTMTFDVLCEIGAKGTEIMLSEPVFMEYLDINDNGGQGYGWLLYRASFQGKDVEVQGVIHDRAHILINGELIATIYNTTGGNVNRQLSFDASGVGSQIIEILVENMGRINTGWKVPYQRKGFFGEVVVDGVKISKWQHIPLEFNKALIKNVQSSRKWDYYVNTRSHKRPTLYRGFMHVDDKPEDTFIDMSKWTKGIVMVNGFVLGRYWNIGPQQTLYVPWPVLQTGQNEVVVFELENPDLHLKFVDSPVLAKLI